MWYDLPPRRFAVVARIRREPVDLDSSGVSDSRPVAPHVLRHLIRPVVCTMQLTPRLSGVPCCLHRLALGTITQNGSRAGCGRAPVAAPGSPDTSPGRDSDARRSRGHCGASFPAPTAAGCHGTLRLGTAGRLLDSDRSESALVRLAATGSWAAGQLEVAEAAAV